MSIHFLWIEGQSWCAIFTAGTICPLKVELPADIVTWVLCNWKSTLDSIFLFTLCWCWGWYHYKVPLSSNPLLPSGFSRTRLEHQPWHVYYKCVSYSFVVIKYKMITLYLQVAWASEVYTHVRRTRDAEQGKWRWKDKWVIVSAFVFLCKWLEMPGTDKGEKDDEEAAGQVSVLHYKGDLWCMCVLSPAPTCKSHTFLTKKKKRQQKFHWGSREVGVSHVLINGSLIPLS